MTLTGSKRGTFAAMYEASKDMSLDGNPRQVRLEALEVLPNQPRRAFDDTSLQELADSIKTHGILQPLLVRIVPGSSPTRYQIVAGERRFRAAKVAALGSVPVVIKNLNDQAALEVALIENLQRDDISPLEEAYTLKQILDSSEMSHRELGERIGKTKAYVEQRVRLLRYPEEVRNALGGQLESAASFTPGHAKAVVQLDGRETREAVITLIQHGGLSVREAERRVQQLKQLEASPALQPARHRALQTAILSPEGLNEQSLTRQLQTRTTTKALQAAPDLVDCRSLMLVKYLQEATATDNWCLDRQALIDLLRQDLRMLAQEKGSGGDQQLGL
jgi:ParB family chromosome partitioning protein